MQEQTSISRVHNQPADVSATLDFLKLILPPEGDHWYVAAIFRDNRINHRWYRTRLEVARALLRRIPGATAYHACGVSRALGGPQGYKFGRSLSRLQT